MLDKWFAPAIGAAMLGANLGGGLGAFVGVTVILVMVFLDKIPPL